MKEEHQLPSAKTLISSIFTDEMYLNRVLLYMYFECFHFLIVIITFQKPFNKTELGCILFSRLCGFEPFFDPRGDQYMYSRILNCDYEFVSPWWDEVSLNAKDLVSSAAVRTNLFYFISQSVF